MRQKAESADNADIPDDMDEAKAEIERSAAERYAEEQKAYEAKIADRAKKEQETGKKAAARNRSRRLPARRKRTR